ncbi:MAG: NTP transferase domain-containing protein [Blautia faecicola]
MKNFWNREEQLAHRTVFSPESRDGASWTIKNGLKAAGDADAFVFFTADQPWLSEETIEGFVCKMEQNHADLGSVCLGETPGNPVWFSREYLPDLLALSGDQGGRRDPEKISGERSAGIRWQMPGNWKMWIIIYVNNE